MNTNQPSNIGKISLKTKVNNKAIFGEIFLLRAVLKVGFNNPSTGISKMTFIFMI